METVSGVVRGEPDITAESKALVAKWQKEILADKQARKDDFKRMRQDMYYARHGADENWVKGKNYTVPLVTRHINQAVAALYARNPKVYASVRKQLQYQLWDGRQDTLDAAMELSSYGDEMAMRVVQEVQEAQSRRQMMNKIAKGLELLWEYYVSENSPGFKSQMKQLVRRAKTSGVAFAEIMFQREHQPDVGVQSRIDDAVIQLQSLDRLMSDMQDGESADVEAEAEAIRLQMAQLQQQSDVLVREGLVYDFPRATEVIPSRQCRQLRGFVGAPHVTREYLLTRDKVKELYQIDIGANNTSYAADKDAANQAQIDRYSDLLNENGSDSAKEGLICVWKVYDKQARQQFVIAQGYSAFLQEPREPDVIVDNFWPIFALTFNETESEDELYPLSDVYHLRSPQDEFNVARQGLKEHRKANRPRFLVKRGMLEDKEKADLESSRPFAVIEIGSADPSVTPEQLIKPLTGAPIDPNLYDTRAILNDVLYGTGSQEANLGPTSGSTATEASIAQQSRGSEVTSAVDELDEFLSEMAKAAGQVMLREVSAETATKIIGAGAVWPELDGKAISEEVYLEVKAGSSGRPNRAAELANIERAAPLLLQAGGVNLNPLMRKYAQLLDLDEEEFIAEGAPSLMAQNAMFARQAQQSAQVNTATDPAMQQMQGAQNTPAPMAQDTGQPEYPTGVI